MRRLELCNPFGAPVFHAETVGSTMDVSRLLAHGGSLHGTVICADFQETGKGRLPGRFWNARRGENLLFTVLLRFPRTADIPGALTLRAGLAAALAIEDFAPALKNGAMIKWPNDVMLPTAAGSGAETRTFRKAVGILAEADGGSVHLGIGVNVSQRDFPAGLREKVTSVALASGSDTESAGRFVLLEKILAFLRAELEPANSGNANAWRERIEARLYMRGARADFAEGPADLARPLAGTVVGVGPAGELLLVPDGETVARGFVSGELSAQKNC